MLVATAAMHDAGGETGAGEYPGRRTASARDTDEFIGSSDASEPRLFSASRRLLCRRPLRRVLPSRPSPSAK